MREADFYEKLADGMVKCWLCPHGCVISQGNYGICSVRRNDNGTLYADSYGAVTSMALDPIEKKPLRRFFSGSRILSIGSYGCNLRCGYCQNYAISMNKAPYEIFTPEGIAAKAYELSRAVNNIGVAYTYNEPLIGYEFVLDCSKLIRARNQKNVLVTNGYIAAEPLYKLLPYIDAMNIDLKAFSAEEYRELGGELADVQRTITEASRVCHVEITALIVPGKNDSEEAITALSGWIAGLSRTIPLHISRFFPNYKMRELPPTPVGTIYRLADAAHRNLEFVYTGNC